MEIPAANLKPSDPPGQAPIPRQTPPVSPRRDAIVLTVCFLVCALHFSDVLTTLVIGLMTVTAYQVFYRRNRKVVALVVSVILSFLALSYFGNIVVRRAIAMTNTTDVDHRNKPSKERGINAEGFRCTADASDFTSETFNILCFGDSFTFGFLLERADQAYPQVLERMIADTHPARRVRMVNCGWVSCSPLIANRALKEHAAKYKPSLIIYALDMTDFQDDLRYAYCDRNDTFNVSSVEFLVDRIGVADEYYQLKNRWQLTRYWDRLRGEASLVPREKFFIAGQPLELSRPYLGEIETNLREMGRFCRDDLRVPFALFFYPRHFQLDARESPGDRDSHFYKVLGPYVFEPFRWFEEFRRTAGFPCYSLLSDFQRDKTFPKFFKDDPHWNPAGHRIAAAAFLRVLKKEGLIP